MEENRKTTRNEEDGALKRCGAYVLCLSVVRYIYAKELLLSFRKNW